LEYECNELTSSQLVLPVDNSNLAEAQTDIAMKTNKRSVAFTRAIHELDACKTLDLSIQFIWE
jgi:hypothetical protein